MAELYRGLAPEEFKTWLTAKQADSRLREAFENPHSARIALIRRLQGGMVRAVAQRAQWSNRAQPADLYEIASSAWDKLTTNIVFWESSDWAHTISGPGYSNITVDYFSVRFDPKAIEAIRDNASEGPIELALTLAATAPPSKGGRPPKEWWEDFWIEMCRLIYGGAIRHEMRQADIQRLMEQWVSDHDHDAGPTVMKEAAKKLLMALKK